MKKESSIAQTIILLSIIIFYCHEHSYAQNMIKTEVFWLDLCKPTELRSLIQTRGRGRLEVNWRDALSFGLTNINQFKYDYKLNSVPFASFVDTSYSSFANAVRANNDLKPDPFFEFEVKAESPSKTAYLNLIHKLDSLGDKYLDISNKMIKIQNDYDFDYKTEKFPENFNKNTKVKKDYDDLYDQYSTIVAVIYKVQQSLNDLIPFANQKIALKQILKQLIIIEGLFNTKNSSAQSVLSPLEESINSLPGYFTDTSMAVYRNIYNGNIYNINNFQDSNSRNLSKLLQVYQLSVQVIRTYFGRFEVAYDTIKNKLLSNQCISLNPSEKKEVNDFIDNFLTTKEVFYNLQSLYTTNPLKNEYLEKYLSAVNSYADFLFKNFMTVKKVIGLETVYLTPTTSNMKNFDLITVELEKTNKTGGEAEKYSYDIVSVPKLRQV